MILDTREKLLRYVFKQLEAILIQNKIYTGKGSPYKQYFDLLLKFINNKSISSFTNFFEVFTNENRPDLREYKLKLEGNIEYLIDEKQRIYIIVDDLDRVEEETVRGTLTFIKEIVNLKGITVLFLVDYKKIISDNFSIEYLEKFINEKFDLQKLNYSELYSHYIKTLIPIYEMDETKEEVKILSEGYETYLKKIDTYINESINSLTNKIKEIKSNDQEELQKDILIESEKRQEHLSNQYIDYENKIRNARYVKKIVSGVKQSFNFFEESLKKEADSLVIENKSLNINELIFKLNIFKMLFKKEYDEIIKTGDIKYYISVSKGEFVKSFFRESEKKIIVNEKEELLNDRKFDFYNKMIFSDDISKEIYKEIKTENEKKIEEIDLSTINEEVLNFEKLTKYILAINLAFGSELQEVNNQRLKKFTKLTMYLFENNKIKLNNIFQLLGDTNRNALIEYPYYYEEIDGILSKHPDMEFESNKDKNSSLYYLNSLETPLIFKNTTYIIMMIDIYYFDNDTYSSIKDSFYSVNKLNDLNKLLIDTLKIEVDKSMSPIEMFANIICFISKEIQKKYNNNNLILRSLKFNEEKINEFIKILRLKVEIVKKVNNIPINDEAVFEALDNMYSKEEVLTHINKLYNYINSNPSKINYRIYPGFPTNYT